MKYSAESVHSRNWQDLRRENTGEAMFNIGRHQQRELHQHNRILKCIIRVKHHTQHTFVFQNERCQYSSHSHSWQTNQTPSVKPVHRKGPHNRFSCPAKSNTFSHRGPDYHQCMNGKALGVACVPLWRCTCEEGNCVELQWKGQDQPFYLWISWKDSQIVLWVSGDSSIKSQVLGLGTRTCYSQPHMAQSFQCLSHVAHITGKLFLTYYFSESKTAY